MSSDGPTQTYSEHKNNIVRDTQTPLMIAARDGHLDIVKVLLQSAHSNQKSRQPVPTPNGSVLTAAQPTIEVTSPDDQLTSSPVQPSATVGPSNPATVKPTSAPAQPPAATDPLNPATVKPTSAPAQPPAATDPSNPATVKTTSAPAQPPTTAGPSNPATVKVQPPSRKLTLPATKQTGQPTTKPSAQETKAIDETDENGRTALMFAARGGFLDIVQFLIKEGAAVDKEDKFGNTAIKYATKNGDIYIVQALLGQDVPPKYRRWARRVFGF